MTAWTNEQIAAFTGGELDASRTEDLRADLARDPGLAARVAHQRQVDTLLDGLEPPTPDPGFSARLRTATAAAVREITSDELAARRERRAVPAWTRFALGGAAAVLALIVGIGVVGGMGGSDDASTDAAAIDDSARGSDMSDSMDAEMFDEAMTEDAMDDSMMAQPSLPDTTPVVVDEGDDFDDDRLDLLAADVRARVGFVAPEDAPQLAADNAVAYGLAPPSPAATADDGGVDAEGAEDSQATQRAPAPLVDTFGVAPDDLRQITTCLAPLLATSTPDRAVIPVEARLGTRDGTRVITYFLVGLDEDTGSYDRVETWVVDRDTCEVVEFRPG